MIEILKNNEIDEALENNHRQYLVGNLKLPQDLKHIKDDEIEVGITKYDKYQWEKPHYHPEVTEYQLLLAGAAKYVDLSTGEEMLIESGDFYIIRPNTKYFQKAVEGTVILFFKNPGKNDKTPLPVTESMAKWAESWENKYEG